MEIEPFLKWPGGKRWLVTRHAALFPSDYERYVEPFLGSGAVFFHLAPRRALLADANPELINTYRCVRTAAATIERRLASLHERHGTKLYYEIRSSQPTKLIDRAVRFLYLNRTCFNGLYRVNRAGRFNVPMGSKTTVKFEPGYLVKGAGDPGRVTKVQFRACLRNRAGSLSPISQARCSTPAGATASPPDGQISSACSAIVESHSASYSAPIPRTPNRCNETQTFNTSARREH
jgi:hypothetical protein